MCPARPCRRRRATPPGRGKSSSASSRGGRYATNISSSMAASSLERGRILIAPETRPAALRRRQNSRTPADDAHEPTKLAERCRDRIRWFAKETRNCGDRLSHRLPVAADTHWAASDGNEEDRKSTR